MSTLLKDKFSKELINKIGERAALILEPFNKDLFIRSVLNKAWQSYELKDRYHHIAHCLRRQLNDNYKQAVIELVSLSNSFKENKLENHQDLVYFFLPAVIENYGAEDFESSVWGMERVTQLISCEFAVRQFFVSHESNMLEVALKWSSHKSHEVRRLATEGCRPALPWGQALQSFKKNPEPILPILENLKTDDSLFVRKSVANNINDISKTHPELVVQLATKWKDTSEETDWILKHGSRTLLKQGYEAILPVFGYLNPSEIYLKEFKYTRSVSEDEALCLSFFLSNTSTSELKIRVEYVISFLRKNGSLYDKTFMISDKSLMPGQEIELKKKHSFRWISTRVYHKGNHFVALRVNGKEMIKKEFILV